MNHFSIYSKGEDKKYNLTQEQYKLYNHLSDEFKGLLIRNFMIKVMPESKC